MSLAQHFPALQVALPLIVAPLCVLLRRGAAAWALATLATWASFVVAAALLLQTIEVGTLSYMMGSWPAPWGIEYRVDTMNAFVLVIVSFVGSVVMPYARASVAAEIPERQHYLFYAMYLLCLAGLLGLAITGDAFNVFVFLEISSLSTYVLIALGRDRRALTAAYQYLIMGTIGATFIVIGIGLLYVLTGTLNMADLASRIPALADTRTVRAALAFLTVGVSLKLALFPLHLWLPNAYAFAPSMVTAFLAATATKVALYVMLRFFYSVFGAHFAFHTMPLPEILMGLSVAAMFIASTVAIFQTNVKRMFAYSSVAQIGYITLGVSFASHTGLTAGVAHLFNHGITKGAIFLLLGCVALRLRSVELKDLAGLARRMPWSAFGLVLGGLSLIGVPATAGFVSKWYLIVAALERGWWWMAALVLASSLLAVAYVWRLVETMYLREPPPAPVRVDEAPLGLLLPAWILVLACIYFGLDTTLSVGVAQQAAVELLRGFR